MSIEKQGTIQQYGASTNGKPKIKIDGQWYFLGKTQIDAGVGDRISFEASAFGERGDLWGINKWGKLPAGNGVVITAQHIPVPALDMSEGERLCVSNWIGQAISAGTIKDPEEIEKWVSASRNALRAQR